MGSIERLVLGLPDGHRGPPAEQLVHQALEVGRQVLQDDEGHPGVGREPREEPLERFKSAGRCADPDDMEPGFSLARVDRHGCRLSTNRASPATQPIRDGSVEKMRHMGIHGVVALPCMWHELRTWVL